MRILAATAILILPAICAAQPRILHEWRFDSTDAEGWQPARHLPEVHVQDGMLSGEPQGHDPQLISPPLDLKAGMTQEVHIRMRCKENGTGELFFTNTFDDPYGGFRPQWMLPFGYHGRGDWQIVRIRPFWQTLGTVRQVRIDPPREGRTDIDWIRIVTLDPDTVAGESSWVARNGILPGWTLNAQGYWEAPPLNADINGRDWLHLDVHAPTEGHATVSWATDQATALQTEEFFLARDGERHTYRLDLGANKAWRGRLIYLALRLTCQNDAAAEIHALELAATPPAEADVQTLYFGPENAPNRVAQPAGILLRLVNTGGKAVEVSAAPPLMPGETLVSFPPDLQKGIELVPDIPWTGRITVRPSKRDDLTIPLSLSIGNVRRRLQSEPMKVLGPGPDVPAGEIPPLRPARTRYRIGTYYYPGFGHPYQWRQLERTAPWAKPVLGYYDEGNPECIDWQIKWAVEHGISFFLVDWYWVAGTMRHEHYLEGLSQARFRDHLTWAVMWANHNPPGTHSEEDWRHVVATWIKRYFSTPQYLRVDGKPAVFIWSPANIRRDVGGQEPASRLYDEAQRMAQEAGLPGITFVAMRQTADENLRQEGYTHGTSYHWWADAPALAPNPQYMPFELIVERSRNGWTTRAEALTQAGLTFLPVVDTGWDARPRHGNNTRVIYGRTPALFQRALEDAKTWMDKRDRDLLILGPVNEWTEGSYIEPCTEFGFDMLQAVHQVFCEGPPPEVVAPEDVNLGPYDFDLTTPGAVETLWTFNEPGEMHGWRALMGLDDVAVREGALSARTVTHDPAFISERLELQTAAIEAVAVTLEIEPPPDPGDKLLVFWGTETTPIHSRAHVEAPLSTEPGPHTYALNLADHRRWRGLLRHLRIDPCLTAGKTVRISRIELSPR